MLSKAGSHKDITIICVAYQRYDKIPVLIHSFLCQTLQNWKLHILHDGFDEKMDRLLSPYQLGHPQISYEFTEQRYDDFGQTLREMGLKDVDTEYGLITNDDNYYVPEFLKLMFEEIQSRQLDMLLCDMVHSHLPTGEGKKQYEYGQYGYLSTFPKKFQVDIGCFIVRTELAKKAGFRDKSFIGDGTFV